MATGKAGIYKVLQAVAALLLKLIKYKLITNAGT
jgi:hypothetical protein